VCAVANKNFALTRKFIHGYVAASGALAGDMREDVSMTLFEAVYLALLLTVLVGAFIRASGANPGFWSTP
jgi:hypothetical protein